MCDIVRGPSLAARTQISVCKSLFPSAGTAMFLFRAKTVQRFKTFSRDHCCRGRSKPGYVTLRVDK